MRVLHLDTGLTMRGGQVQMLTLYRGLQDHGELTQQALARGELRAELECGHCGPLELLRAAAEADLIHAHDARAHTLAALFSPRKPLVVSRRVAFPPRRGWASRWKYRRADRLLAVSEYVAGLLADSGVERERIRVVPDGVAARAQEPSARRLRFPPKVVAIDSDDPGKGTAAARAACEQAGCPLQLSRNLAADLADADIFLYLSDNEGLGSAILLAGAYELPIVASRVGGIPEIVRDEETGLLVENDLVGVATAIRRFGEDPELAGRCARNARRQAVERFSDDMLVSRTLAVYCELYPPPEPHAPQRRTPPS